MDIINDYLKRTRNIIKLRNGYFEGVRPRIVCNDGFSVSVQASVHTYCTPRIDGADEYTSVELGFPSAEDKLIIEYAEDPDEPTETVYGYVPINIVVKLIEKHGGIVSTKGAETEVRI